MGEREGAERFGNGKRTTKRKKKDGEGEMGTGVRTRVGNESGKRKRKGGKAMGGERGGMADGKGR